MKHISRIKIAKYFSLYLTGVFILIVALLKIQIDISITKLSHAILLFMLLISLINLSAILEESKE
jgi:hypothetical protein